MAYGLKYSQYLEKGGATLQIRVYEDGWSGASYGMAHITGAALQIVGGQSDILAPFIKTMFSFSMADCWDQGVTQADGTTCVNAQNEKCGEWEEFYTPDASKFRVELWAKATPAATAVCIWTGYVTPDSWSENMAYRGSVTITARDMLGTLRDKEFNLTGRVSILDIVQGALSAASCPMSLSYTAGHFLVNEDGSSLLDHTIAASTFSGKTWQEALEETLESLGLVLRYNGANTIVLTSLRYIKADTTSGSHTIEFISNSGLRQLDPALRSITETFDVDLVAYNAPDPAASQFARTGGTITCSMTSPRPNQQGETATGQLYAYTLTRANNEGWAGTLGIPLYGTIGGGVPSRGIYFPTNVQDTQGTFYADYTNPRIDKSFKFRLLQDGSLVKATNGASSSASFEVYNGVAVVLSEINIRVEATANNTTYYLNQQGAWVTELSYITVATGEEVDVPTLNGGSGYKIVVKSLRTAGATDNVRPVAPLLAALLLEIAPNYDSTSPTEFKTTTVYNENNNVIITRQPTIGSATINECIEFYQNVLGLGAAISADRWNWPGESGYYPLAVMIQAQALCYHAAAASVFTGTAHDKNTASALALPGCAYTYYERGCVAVSGTYDFASGFLAQSNFREVYTWEDVWGETFQPQYTRTQGAGRGSTSATGAGGTSITPGGNQGGGVAPGGINYFEQDDDQQELIKLKAAYSYLGPKKGLIFDTTEETDVASSPAHLMLRNLGTAQSPNYALYTPFALITGGDQIVGSGTPGGGGSGAGFLYELKDTISSWTAKPSVSATQVLVFDPSSTDKNSNTGAWKYVPATDIGRVYSGGTGITIDQNTNEISVTANTYAPYNSAGYLPLSGGVLSANNTWLSPARLQLLRSDTTHYTDRACIGVTNGNLHIDAYSGKTLYLNFYSGLSTIYVGAGDGTTQYTVYHTGNLSPITTSNYSSYCLPISGGTLQGSNPCLLTLNNTTANNAVEYIMFKSNGTLKATVGYVTGVLGGAAFLANETRSAYLAIPNSGDPVWRVGATSGTSYTLYHSGNFTPGNYVLKAGDTMTGALTINSATGTSTPTLTLKGGSGNVNLVYERMQKSDGTHVVDVGWCAGSSWGVPNTGGFYAYTTSGSGVTLFLDGDGLHFGPSSDMDKYIVWDAHNSNLTTVNWACQNLTLKNNGMIIWVDSNGVSKECMRMNTGNNLLIGYDTGRAGYDTGIYGHAIYFNYGTSATTGILLSSTGNVGIGHGTTTPSVRLDVLGASSKWTTSFVNAANTFAMYTCHPSYGLFLETTYNANNRYLITAYKGRTALGSGGEIALLLRSDGNFGVGCDPSYKFHVKGGSVVFSNIASGTSSAAIVDTCIGVPSYTWGGASNNFPMLYEYRSDGTAFMMIATPHIPYLENGKRSYGGSTLNARVRFEASAEANATYWDAGVCAADVFAIQRAGTGRLSINSSGQTLFSGTYYPASSWTAGTTVFGSDGNNKVIIGYLSGSPYNFAVVAAHNSALNDWANLYLGAKTQITFWFGSSAAGNITNAGVLTTTGDQVISSDIIWKTNLQPVRYTIEDIAKCRAVTFDWKDGRGKSAGSIAQDWKPLIPELVHGEEGNMTLAYGQIALINSILLAKHETEQDKEIKKLKNRVKELENEVKRLRS